jgi:hypothetical protein
MGDLAGPPPPATPPPDSTGRDGTAPRRRLTWRRLVALAVVLALTGVLVTGLAVETNTLGAGRLFDRAVAKVDRFLAGPVPDRPAPSTELVVTPDDSNAADLDPDEIAAGSPDPGVGPVVTPVPAPTATRGPAVTAGPTAVPRKAVDVSILKNPAKYFAHEIKDTWCAPAGVQMALTILGHGNTSAAFQRELQSRVHEWESRADALDGLWGPSAMTLALDAYGAKGYQVRAYKTRQGALRDAAKAIQKTNSPVLLMAWRGAHTWVMSGFRADADPSVFPDAKILGTYILDPWYPDISSIWGPSDPPGTYQNEAEMIRNYLKWKRPEGRYPDRDGLYLAVVPTIKAR